MLKRSTSLLAVAVLFATALVGLTATVASAAGAPPTLVTPVNGAVLDHNWDRVVTVSTAGMTDGSRWTVLVICPQDGDVGDYYLEKTPTTEENVSFTLSQHPSWDQTCEVDVSDADAPSATSIGSFDVVYEIPTLTMSSVTRSSANLYPYRVDGYLDSVRLGWYTNTAAHHTITVRNAAGTVVRSASLSQSSEGGRSWAWNGRNNAGRVVALGTYTIRVEALGNDGQRNAFARTVVVRRGVVTTSKLLTRPGSGGVKATRGPCYATRDYDEETTTLDCWGGKFARVTFNVAIPKTATRVSWAARGHLDSADICCKGKVKRTGKRIRPGVFQVRVQINGWRAFDVTQVRVLYYQRMTR